MKKSVELHSVRAEEAKAEPEKKMKYQPCTNLQGLQNFCNPLPHLTFCWFLFVFVPISPYVIVFILYTLVICIDLVVCNTQKKKKRLCRQLLIIEVLRKLENKLPFSLVYLIFSLFLVVQTPSKDGFSLFRHSLSLMFFPSTLCFDPFESP